MTPREEPKGLIPAIVRQFLKGKEAILFLVFALCLGAGAIMLTPREEEPQIIVPMADVFVQAPGASAMEVENLVAAPLEQLLWQIDGVEYVYSVSEPDQAMATVRFFVGQDREDSLLKLHNAIAMNKDLAPSIVSSWVVKPVEIDDVPIVTLTLYSGRYNDHELRRMAEELQQRLAEVPNVSRVYITGGRAREIRVELSHERMTGFNVTPNEIIQSLQGADASVTAGNMDSNNQEFTVTANSFLHSAKEAEELVVGVFDDRPVYLRDVATVIDGPEEANKYSRYGLGARHARETGQEPTPDSYPAVTIALAKKKGTNAVDVANNILARMQQLQDTMLPQDVTVDVTRNYGETAQTKVNDLLSSLFFAILTVVILLAMTLGWREALVVAVAVPVSFSLALFVNYLFGYTINRVTMFALILSLGLVVDDPITNVDNIQRHILMGVRKPFEATLFAVQEVLPPVIMSTLAIIVSFTPMFFITGMMGPYMAPMAANVPLTVTFSTVCALTIVPWLSYKLLKRQAGAAPDMAEEQGAAQPRDVTPPFIRKGYRAVVAPFLSSRALRWLLALAVIILLLASCSLALLRLVPLKMLPFDNKNEFQIVLDMPEGISLETTDRAVRAFEDYLRGVPEVTSFVAYTGENSPMDFNGMVRHYYLRKSSHQADIRVNLAKKDQREQQSHAIILRLRNDLERIAKDYGASLKIVEVPPGPPVISTITAEIYGTPDRTYDQLIQGAKHIQELLHDESGVVDIDASYAAPSKRVNFVPDKEKAALHGVTTAQITRTLRTAIEGISPAKVHQPHERQPLHVKLVLPREKRSSVASLAQIPIKSAGGDIVPLGELGEFSIEVEDQPVYHKNLQPVVYVYAEMAGRAPGEAILDLQARLKESPLPPGVRAEWAGEGEWKITLRVFRDLGIAFGAALLGIYLLLIIQTDSFSLPLLIMMAIPLTLLGIMPGFWLLNEVFTVPVGGFDNPIFFTATSMIGMIALGGIVIRNSLVLIEFIQDSMRDGMELKESILQSGAIRLRPIVLTAMTTALGAWPITLDPIFSGLAWALIFGLFASTLFTLLIIPVAYYAVTRKKVAA